MALAFFESVHANPWSETFLDLPTLNAETSDAIEVAIRSTRATARTQPSELRSSCLTVLGPAGAGKTHLFGRLRRRLGPRAVFVHIRPLVGVEMTHRFVLHEIVRQLGYATVGLRQVDALVGSLLAHLRGGSSLFPQFFVEDYTHLEPSVQTERLEEVVDRVLSTWQELDESYLRRLLSVPFRKSPVDRALLAWLSGRELDAVQLERIGSSGALPEEAVLPGLKTLAAVASIGAPIVIVFDQLENLIDRELASSRLLAYAQLTTDLVDCVQGLVIVQMALDTEWTHGLLPSFNLAQRSRLTMQSHVLGLPTPQQKEDLLRLWLERLPNRVAPFPWPLGESRVTELCGQPGMTPRMLLISLRQMLGEEQVAAAMSAAEAARAEPIAADGEAATAGREAPVAAAEAASSQSEVPPGGVETASPQSQPPSAGAMVPTADSNPAGIAVDLTAVAPAQGTDKAAPAEADARVTPGAAESGSAESAAGGGEGAGNEGDAADRASVLVHSSDNTDSGWDSVLDLELDPHTDGRAALGGPPKGPARESLDVADEQTRREESLELAWDDHLAKARELLDEAASQARSTEPVRLIDGVLAALRFVPSLRPIDVRAARPAQIRLLRGKAEVHLALLHQAHFRSVGLALTKLCDLAQSEEVVAVREQAQALPPTWVDTLARLDVFMARPKARWLWLAREQTARLLALDDLLKSARSRDVTDHRGHGVDEAFVCDWVGRTLGIAQWPLFALLRGESSEEASVAGSSASEPRMPASATPPAQPSESASPPAGGTVTPRPPPARVSPRPVAPSPTPQPTGATAGVRPNGTAVQLGEGGPAIIPGSRGAANAELERAPAPSADGAARRPAPDADMGAGPVLSVLTRLRLASLDRLLREVSRVNRASTRASVLEEIKSLAPRVRWIGRNIVFLQEDP